MYTPTAIKKSLFVLLVLAVLGALALLAASPAAAAENSVLVRVSAQDAAKTRDIETIRTIDYGSFVLLELSAENVKQLAATGVDFELQPAPGNFRIQGQAVDTSTAQPGPQLLRRSTAASAPELQLVQVLGPMKNQWSEQMQAAGIRPLRYFNPYVHLVYMTAEQAATVAGWEFVRWVGPYLPHYRISNELLQLSGQIEYVDVSIMAIHLEATIAEIELLGGALVDRESAPGPDGFISATFTLPATALTPVSQLGSVAWISYRAPVDDFEDEMSDQIIVGNFGPIITGYQTWLTTEGVDGSGITVALIDSGYDTGVDGTSHADLSGRLVMVGTPTDGNGHGTHVGGIIAGNASTTNADASGYLLGLGVAPAANLVVRVNSGADSDRQRDAVTRGAVASNNSYRVNSAGSAYSARDATLDALVRDANTNTAANEQMSIIFSAGNSGVSGPTKNAKNIIAVGNSFNERDGDGTVNTGLNIDALATGSSRGPAADGRTYPHVSAPGSRIVSTMSSQAGLSNCGNRATGANAPLADPTYSTCSGTSMAAPHVTGSTALIHEWWAGALGGAPSPAMVKALLVNGAVDMGTADIPNNNEGWGRINLSNVINTGVATRYLDQSTVFATSGETWIDNFSPMDPSRQVKVTIAWTDAPGTPGGTADLVNDLDLVVADNSNTFRGNVFANGLSTTGGAADTLNNLESVYVANTADAFSVSITAAGINGDGIPGNGDATDQDFALVCTNCIPNDPPVCDADGPYTAECSANTQLDGSGSSDPDGPIDSYTWSGPFTGSPTSGVTPIVVFPTPTGLKSVDLEVDDGLASTFCSSPVIVEDTLAPTITAPGDLTEECASPAGTPVDLGLAVASDTCDPNPVISNDAPALFPLGDTLVSWTATDDDGNQNGDGQVVTIEDTLPPELFCNSPATIVPPDAAISFTASAVDQCQGPITPEITGYDCFKFTKKGKRIDKTRSCVVSFDGDTVTISDSGGVDTFIEWTLSVEDDQGNTAQDTCSLQIANPEQS